MTQHAHENRAVSLPVNEPEGSRWAKAHHILLGFLLFSFMVWILSGFYSVRADEVAIVERLGEYLKNDQTDQGKTLLVETGLHYHLPWPIDTVYKIPVQQTRTLAVDTFFASPDAYADLKKDYLRDGWPRDVLDAIFDPYLITADKNVVHIKIAVTYRIDDPVAWVTSVSHEDAGQLADSEGQREELFRQIVQHVMIAEVAKLPVNSVLFEGSENLRPLFTAAIQQAMKLPDSYKATGVEDLGVLVQKVDIVDKGWPQTDLVDKAFQGVLNAQASQAIFIQQATQQADGARTQAQSQYDTMLREAEAYKQRVMDEARGEASRFSQVLEQYQQAPDVTRWNVYVEAVGAVSGAANRIMFVQPGEKSTLMIDPPQFDAAQVQPNK